MKVSETVTGRLASVMVATWFFMAIPAGAASLTEGGFWIIGSANAPTSDLEFKVSVYPGNSGFAGRGNVGTTSVLVDEVFNAPVIDYAFYTDGGSTNTALTYASGGGAYINPLTGLFFSSGYFGSPDYGNVWTSTDPGIGYATPPDFNNNTMLGNVNYATGSIDISGLESGYIYFFTGAYSSRLPNDITMIDTNGLAPDLTIVDAGDNDTAQGNEAYAYRIDFVNDNGYDVITYSLNTTSIGASIGRGRYMGLVLTYKGASISKSVSAEAVNLDRGVTNLIYTLEIANAYTTALGGVTVTDALPAEVSFVSATPPADMTNGNELVFNVGAVGPETSVWITIEAQVTSTVPAVITNVASFSATNTNVLVTANQDTARTLLYRPADLELNKTAAFDGSNLVYTLAVTNLGSGAATGVSVVDTLPAALTYLSATPTPVKNGNRYTFNLGTLASGSGTSLTLSAFCTSAVPLTVTNTAVAATTWFEVALSNNTGRVASIVGGGKDLSLTKSVEPASLLSGTSLVYTLTVMNLSTVEVANTWVTDSLPAEVTFVSADPPPAETNGNALGFFIGWLPAGGGTDIVIRAGTVWAFPGAITNVAELFTTNTDVNPVNDADIAVTLLPDSDSDGIANPGDPDDDNDRMPDADEAIAGTDPFNALSYLWVKIARTNDSDSVCLLTFPGVTGRTYRVQTRTNLHVPPWVDVQTNIPGPPVINRLMNVWRTNMSERIYYRIGVE